VINKCTQYGYKLYTHFKLLAVVSAPNPEDGAAASKYVGAI